MTPTCHWCGYRDAIDLDEERKPICATCSAEPAVTDPPEYAARTSMASRVLAAVHDGAKSRAEVAERLGVDPWNERAMHAIGTALSDLRNSGRITGEYVQPGNRKLGMRYAPARETRAA